MAIAIKKMNANQTKNEPFETGAADRISPGVEPSANHPGHAERDAEMQICLRELEKYLVMPAMRITRILTSDPRFCQDFCLACINSSQCCLQPL